MRKCVGIFRLQQFKVSESFIVNQTNNFVEWTPIHVGARRFGEPPPGCSAVTMPYGRLGSLSHKLFRSERGFVHALADRRLDLIHAHFAVDGVYASPLAKALSVPLVTTLHGFDVTRTDASLVSSLRPALINSVLFRKELCNRANAFLCVSEHIRNSALRRGFPASKLRVHYIGINADDFAPQPVDRRSQGIIHVARLVEKKGTAALLEAFALLVHRYAIVAPLTIIGDGPLRKSLERKSIELGIAEYVSFLGARPNSEVRSLLSTSTIMVVPSVTAPDGDTEGLPTVLMEAAALEIPVIASDSGGVCEAVVDGVSGFVVRERDVEALAHRMASLLTDADLRRRLGESGRTLVRERFDAKRQTRKLESIYDELC